jgi:hypothetical protein
VNFGLLAGVGLNSAIRTTGRIFCPPIALESPAPKRARYRRLMVQIMFAPNDHPSSKQAAAARLAHYACASSLNFTARSSSRVS